MKAKVMCSNADFQENVEQFLDDLLMDVDTDHYFDEIEVRFIKSDCTFGYASVYDLFFYRDVLFFWTQDKNAKDCFTLSDFELTGRLKYLEVFEDIKIQPVMFAGFYTGYRDDKGQKIYTGDVVKATMFMEADIPSNGEMSRARIVNERPHSGYTTIAGVNSFGHRNDDYYYILDQIPVPLRNTKKVKVIGNVFYDLDPDSLSVNIGERCAMLAYPYKIHRRNLHIKMAHAPYFISKTWQDKALKFLRDEPCYEDLPIHLP